MYIFYYRDGRTDSQYPAAGSLKLKGASRFFCLSQIIRLPLLKILTFFNYDLLIIHIQ